jgi:hypothetical protein
MSLESEIQSLMDVEGHALEKPALAIVDQAVREQRPAGLRAPSEPADQGRRIPIHPSRLGLLHSRLSQSRNRAPLVIDPRQGREPCGSLPRLRCPHASRLRRGTSAIGEFGIFLA